MRFRGIQNNDETLVIATRLKVKSTRFNYYFRKLQCSAIRQG